MKLIKLLQITLIFSCILFSFSLFSQDATVVGFNGDSPDGYTVLALTDIPDTKNIFVTDMAYGTGTGQFTNTGSANEGTLRITWTGTWAKGTMIKIVETTPAVIGAVSTFDVFPSANAPADANVTNVYSTGFSLTTSEGLSTFTSTNLSNPAGNVAEIYSFVRLAGSGDPDPGADGSCPCSSSFISVDFADSNIDGVQFNPANRDNVTVADLENLSNWITSADNVDMTLSPEFTNLAVLPIDLMSFRAEAVKSEVLLTWETASEKNNDYVEIQRSLDGRHFEKIGRVDGNGDSDIERTYQFVDENPYTGLNYYRLRQMDFDGTETIFKIVSAKIEGKNSPTIYPNPAREELTIFFGQELEEEAIVTISDIAGRSIFQDVASVRSLNLTIQLDDLKEEGIYLVRIESKNSIENIPFVKN